MKEFMNSISYSNDAYVVENKSRFLISFNKYLIYPLMAGFKGFSLVFLMLIGLKFISFLFSADAFIVDLLDIMLALTGFTLTFIVDLLKNFN